MPTVIHNKNTVTFQKSESIIACTISNKLIKSDLNSEVQVFWCLSAVLKSAVKKNNLRYDVGGRNLSSTENSLSGS